MRQRNTSTKEKGEKVGFNKGTNGIKKIVVSEKKKEEEEAMFWRR